jgi:uncharacterized protein YbaP (TraB family)
MQRHTISARLDINGRPIWTDTTTTDGDYVLHDEAMKEIVALGGQIQYLESVGEQQTLINEGNLEQLAKLKAKLSRWEKLMPGMMEE